MQLEYDKVYELTVNDHFSAAHYLREYQGKCSQMHGHNWSVDVGVLGSGLDRLGMVIDLGILKDMLGQVMSELDHKVLNDITPFDSIYNPTSENIAAYIGKQLEVRLKGVGGNDAVCLSFVRVWEGPKTSVTLWYRCPDRR